MEDPIKIYGARLVVHVQTSPQAVDDLLALLRTLAEEKKAAGFVPNSQANGTNGTFKEAYARRGTSIPK